MTAAVLTKETANLLMLIMAKWMITVMATILSFINYENDDYIHNGNYGIGHNDIDSKQGDGNSNGS